MKLFKKEDWVFQADSGYDGYRSKTSGWWIYKKEYELSVLITKMVFDLIAERGHSSAIVDVKSWLSNPPHKFDSNLYEAVLKTLESKD